MKRVNFPIISIVAVIGFLVMLLPSEGMAAQMTAEQENIKRLLALSHVDLVVKDIITQTMKKLEFSFPQVPPEEIQHFIEQVDTDQAVEGILVPIYEKHFSPSEIEELVTFYESPVGKKLMALQPQIMQETIDAIKPWGDRLAREFINQHLDTQK